MRYFHIILGSRRRIRSASHRGRLGIHFLGRLFGSFGKALPRPRLIRIGHPEPPFFTRLSRLLDQDRELTLGSLVDAAGEQTYGLLVVLMALPGLVPGLNLGAAPLGGVGIMATGIQMFMGRQRPWLPQRLRRQPIHRGGMKRALATLEGYLERFGGRREQRRALNQPGMGLVVAWVGLLLCLPVPLPFGNQLPALILVVLGAGLLEQRPAWGWLGALAGVGNTLYFALSIQLIGRGSLRVFRALEQWKP